ncbi:MAG: hydantoinase B/oxoprolinase family protein [Capsulimonadales bacterium]|nr:hydantoinase B/oxoprolinase family protein [Capsulimonadales bacterium]
MDTGLWLICADTGGTFTDGYAIDPAGRTHRAKALSSSALRGTVREVLDRRTLVIEDRWDAPAGFADGFLFRTLEEAAAETRIARYEPGRIVLEEPLPSVPPAGTTFEAISPDEAPILVARLLTRTPAGKPLPPHTLRLATTRGTNALLTRTGTPPAFFVTGGHADLLFIGTQQRPDLFAESIVRPAPLYSEVIEVAERLDAGGTVLRPLDAEEVRRSAERGIGGGARTAAVCLLHSYRNPEHERRVAAILRAAGFTHVSLSSELAPLIKALPRARTAVVNAYLAPILERYVERVAEGRGTEDGLRLMTSAGGLVAAAGFRPKDSLLSGPAGGIVGAATAGRRAGFDRIIAFDMGGTSTDVARFDGDYDYVFEHTVGDAHLMAPALAIESVAAGGGSICVADRHGLRVGPESAGATPGPACYGAGGPLTITDIHLLLGHLSPERFGIPLSWEAAQMAFERLRANLERETGTRFEPRAVLESLLAIANERMADAIRKISVRQGYDPSKFALLSFGGAGGQHACAVAERLGIRTVLVPPDASLLSAFGLANAVIERFAERQVLKPLGPDGITEEGVASLVSELTEEAFAALRTGEAGEPVLRRTFVRLRLIGQETSLDIEPDGRTSLADAFAGAYVRRYGHHPPDGKAIETESVRVVAGIPAPMPAVEPESGPFVEARGTLSHGEFERDAVTATEPVAGPARIVEAHSVFLLPEGWICRRHETCGALIAERVGEGSETETGGESPFAIELFSARFAAIAEEMGEMLRRTAVSTNVKERLDFSCAVLHPNGDLIASAAHIPVHLGALGACVRQVRDAVRFRAGDVWVTNHPAFGGSHLPDVTVITPVFQGERPIGIVASRAHHAEIGGLRPGSMPPDATNLAQEGVVLPPFPLVEQGVSRLDELCALLTNVPYPTRSPADNRADLEAALAANHQGAKALLELARTVGAEAVERRMNEITDRSERLARAALTALGEGESAATETLDDGTPIRVRITVAGGAATVDFTGTGPTHPGNRNAPPAVVRSAVLYVLRLLIGEPIPLNEGLLRPVTLVLPPDSLVNPPFDPIDPTRCPAVVGGNVETSQRIVDTLLKALGHCAASQGTMNNILWGTATFGYYETVCGGAGGTRTAAGASCVHTHMTNTRMTDTEVIEARYPVRIERFARRHGSGGAGRHPGGDGVLRETHFLAPMELSVLTERRMSGPFGMAGGEPGEPGRQTLIRADGETTLRSTDGANVLPGDRLILETPGGGGFGQA